MLRWCQEVLESLWNADREEYSARCRSQWPRYFWCKDFASEVRSLQLDFNKRSSDKNLTFYQLPNISEFVAFLTLLTLRAYPGRSIWMEIVQRLVAVFLVSVVASANGLQLSVAITLMMAATSAMVQPYARPQVRLWVWCSDDFSMFHAFLRLCLSEIYACRKSWMAIVLLGGQILQSSSMFRHRTERKVKKKWKLSSNRDLIAKSWRFWKQTAR